MDKVAASLLQDFYRGKITLSYQGLVEAAIFIGRFYPDYPDKSHEFLHPTEQEIYDSYKFKKRKNTFFMGRYCAKEAISLLTGTRDYRQILVGSGVFNQPIVSAVTAANIQVSITHCDDVAAAVAFREEYPLGIDLERIVPDKIKVLETQITDGEKELLKDLKGTQENRLTLFWTVKEALSKVLKTGLMTPFHLFEIKKVEAQESRFCSSFRNFPQYKAISMPLGGYWMSLVYPKNMAIDFGQEGSFEFLECK